MSRTSYRWWLLNAAVTKNRQLFIIGLRSLLCIAVNKFAWASLSFVHHRLGTVLTFLRKRMPDFNCHYPLLKSYNDTMIQIPGNWLSSRYFAVQCCTRCLICQNRLWLPNNVDTFLHRWSSPLHVHQVVHAALSAALRPNGVHFGPLLMPVMIAVISLVTSTRLVLCQQN